MMTDKIHRFQDGDAGIITDGTYFPITIYTWYGTPTMPVVEEYYKRRWEFDARARAEGTKVIMVSDIASLSTPPASIRKEVAERARETDKSDAFHFYYNSVPNALLRGVVTAMQWIAGDDLKPAMNLGSMVQCLQRSVEELQRIGLKAPDFDPKAYEPPSRQC